MREKYCRRGMIALACAFLISLGGLVSLGAYTVHDRRVARETAAALLAADLLALEAKEETAHTVALALAQSRLPALFSERERRAISAFLREASSEESVATLCASIREAAAEGELCAAWLVREMRALPFFPEKESAGVVEDVGETDNLRYPFRELCGSVQASEFLGISALFRDAETEDSATAAAYCQNAFLAFRRPRGEAVLFFRAFDEGEVRYTDDDCRLAATRYLEKHFSLRNAAVTDSHAAWGVLWMRALSGKSSFTLGVRKDTGEVCFFCRS